jgi:hypothetical protein
MSIYDLHTVLALLLPSLQGPGQQLSDSNIRDLFPLGIKAVHFHGEACLPLVHFPDQKKLAGIVTGVIPPNGGIAGHR